MRLRALAVVSALLLVPSFVFAQATGTGTVTGHITDSSGAVLPGATVTLKSDQALGQYTGVTDSGGIYRISSLQPAAYEARAELQGFQAKVQRVSVHVGAIATVDFTLSVGSMTETVEVLAELPTVDPERAGLAVNVNNTALTSLPVSTQRRYQDIWALVPGVFVRPDSPDINPSVNSRGTSENSTKLDGMDVTDPFGGGVFSVNFNYDAIQDIQVKTLGAEAEDGARTGGFMSIVTKSGGNTVHGSAALFVIPKSFNSSNIANAPANQRKDLQPDLTLGGPIQRDRVWFFGAYRRAQEDQTLNNAPIPREKRGNLLYLKVTDQLNPNHRLFASFQYDRTVLHNAVIRSTVTGATSATSGLMSATPQLSLPGAFGQQITGGPLVGMNYTWVMSQARLFQFVGSWMINKPQDNQAEGDLVPTRVIQTNATGNILGNLTTIAQDGFGVNDISDRSMVYLSPTFSFYVNRWGSHDFKLGAELYPRFRNATRRDISPVEYYFRPPGTTGANDVLFQRDTFVNLAGTGSSVTNLSYEHYNGGYFQDRWKPRSNISIKAGVRLDSNQIYTSDRQKVLAARLPSGVPINTSDQEFNQTTVAPNGGVAWDLGRLGVFRGTAGRYYEWLDLGGGDGTTHAPYVVATNTARANPRSGAPTLNDVLPGAFPIGVNYGQGNKKTYTNEFSAGWEKKLPAASSLGITFLLKRTWDFQGSDDVNIIRNPATGALVDRPLPQFDAILRSYAPNYSFQQFRSLQFLYTKDFGQRWGVNANYWYAFHQSIQLRFNPTRDFIQYLGFTPDDNTNNWVSPRHQARGSAFVRLPGDVMVSGFYTFTQGPRFDILTGLAALGSTAPVIVLSNGRRVSDPFYTGTAANAFPRARRRNVDLLSADSPGLVNLRIQKGLAFGGPSRHLAFSADFFNLFNSAAAFDFLSKDDRSSNFGVPTNTVAARVAQVGIRVVF